MILGSVFVLCVEGYSAEEERGQDRSIVVGETRAGSNSAFSPIANDAGIPIPISPPPAIGQTLARESDKQRFAFRTDADTGGPRTELTCWYTSAPRERWHGQ